MIKTTVWLSDELTKLYVVDVTDEVEEHYNECISNGSNKWLEEIDIEHYSRPIKESLLEAGSLDKYNRREDEAHFIFGWFESFCQSDNIPEWMSNSDKLTIEVRKDGVLPKQNCATCNKNSSHSRSASM